MAKFIGKIILKTISGNEVTFIVWYLKNAPFYWVVIKGVVFNSLTKIEGNNSGYYGLGQMFQVIKSLTNEGGKIEYNDLPKNIMDIANKEAIILNL